MRTEKHDHITDNDLLERFYTDRDNKWLGILLERYTMLLLGVCMKYLKNEDDARDGVQQVFLKTITELHKYRVEFFKSWIYMVARNHCLMRLRDRQGKVPAELTDRLLEQLEQETGEKSQVEQEQAFLYMESAMDDLNPGQKQCVTLFYLEKKSYQQIADETGLSLMQVKSNIQNGKRNLKIMIEKKIQEQQNTGES